MPSSVPYTEALQLIRMRDPPLGETDRVVVLADEYFDNPKAEMVGGLGLPPNTLVPHDWKKNDRLSGIVPTTMRRYRSTHLFTAFKKAHPQIARALAEGCKGLRAAIPVVAGSSVLKRTGAIAAAQDIDVFLVRREGATDEAVERDALRLAMILCEAKGASQDYCAQLYEVRRGLITISNMHEARGYDDCDVQIVLRRFGTVGAVFKSFDLQICAFGLVYDDEPYAAATPLALWSAMRRVFVADVSRCSATFDLRVVKYFNRGLGVHFADVPEGEEFAPAGARTLLIPDDERCGPEVVRAPGHARGIVAACGARRPCGAIESALVTTRLIRASAARDYDPVAEPEAELTADDYLDHGRVGQHKNANLARVAAAARARADPEAVARRFTYAGVYAGKAPANFLYRATEIARRVDASFVKKRVADGRFDKTLAQLLALSPREIGAIAALAAGDSAQEARDVLDAVVGNINRWAERAVVKTWFIDPSEFAHGSPSHIKVDAADFYGNVGVIRPPRGAEDDATPDAPAAKEVKGAAAAAEDAGVDDWVPINSFTLGQ